MCKLNYSSSGIFLIAENAQEKRYLKTYVDRVGCSYKNGELYIQLPFRIQSKPRRPALRALNKGRQ
jgi:hypothetical protein